MKPRVPAGSAVFKLGSVLYHVSCTVMNIVMLSVVLCGDVERRDDAHSRTMRDMKTGLQVPATKYTSGPELQCGAVWCSLVE